MVLYSGSRWSGRSTVSGGDELGNADEIVGDEVEHEVGADGGEATMLGLAHGAVQLAPAEDALGHGPARLGDAVADVPGGALVDGAGAPPPGLSQGVVLGDVRGDVDAAQGGHVVAAVISLVLADRDAAAPSPGLALEHRLRGAPFGRAVGLADRAGDSQAIAVLHDHVAHVAQLRLAAGRLAIELGIGVAGRSMGVVLAPLAMEVGAIVVLAAILRLEALVRGPGLDQRAVDREMIVR